MEDTCGSKKEKKKKRGGLIQIKICALIKADWKGTITSVKGDDN